MWLHGAAGAGKTAIAQSITERCQELKIAIASFFFFRGDHTRNSIQPLVATLAYQLALIYPIAKEKIIRAIEHDPLTFERSFETQLKRVILKPLLQLKTYRNPALVIVIDGLDECEGRQVQASIIRTISDAVKDETKNLPLLFLIASRPEQHLTMAFSSREVVGVCDSRQYE
ncbi:hypothetical protein CPB84DRAFT_1465450 [Gymnopilus junonius]|uniref:Nephrocystin 3-like N-terminal domain-containing protein n=1 Tax=Gymnopilus junonius TaxID=109634 RepID=A0A9P5TJJ9_GYMJU|nr:hypothetical protein CPB84DRAFT_1465450 [Gymnopilus junonius]